MHNSPFSVAGMSSSSNVHHSHGPNLNTWGSTGPGGSLTSTFTDSLSQSRSHYQPGYMMSSQTNNAPQGNQRVDEAPVVQTKAKVNHVLSRGSTSDFGMESMFESSRQRQTLADEDAPPTNSVNDIPTEIHVDSPPARFQPRNSTFDGSPFTRRHTRTPSVPQPSQTLFIIVFGYPADKYSVTVEYFKSLGDATDPDPNTEIMNCFRIGYKDAGDAMRAVRKNGEILGGSWMVGAKWADPAQAEALLGQPVARASGMAQLPADAPTSPPNAMSVDEPSPLPHRSASATPTVGTPIKLAPSASAFRRAAAGEKTHTPQRGGVFPGGGGAAGGFGDAGGVSAGTPGQSPSKGVLGQVSDLIFGW